MLHSRCLGERRDLAMVAALFALPIVPWSWMKAAPPFFKVPM